MTVERLIIFILLLVIFAPFARAAWSQATEKDPWIKAERGRKKHQPEVISYE
jgi:hypothetical protein